MSRKKIGLLTFHAAYNYGSVLQAYATNRIIRELACDCDTINFRFRGQEKMYALYDFTGSIRSKLSNFYVLPKHISRALRSKRFERFITQELHTTQIVRSRADIVEKLPKYDTYLCGGDQLWNLHVGEYALDADVANVFYLDFAHDIRKASFSTSIGNMKLHELEKKRELLEDFSYLSTRESVAVGMIEKAIEYKAVVDEVMDPVFLLKETEWNELAVRNRVIKGKYLLVYSLGSRNVIRSWADAVAPFAKKFGLKVVFISPKFSAHGRNTTTILSAGPREFLNLYANAEVVIADTFHALCFAILYRKPFYVLGNKYYKDDIRKTALLEKLKLSNRILTDERLLKDIDDYAIDYVRASSIINDLRARSIECLQKAIGIDG